MKKSLIIGVLAALMLSCASQTDKDIEQARFALDHGDFSLAVELAKPIVDAEPKNNEAKFILASAYVGVYALNPKPGCDKADVGYLGLLACILDNPDSTDSIGLRTFDRIAPADNSLNDDINLAVTLLTSISKYDDVTPLRDVALQRLVARVFAISTIYQTIGANSENLNKCYTGGTGSDGVPDDYDANLITADDADLYIANLAGIQQDAIDAGLNADFELLTRATEILNTLNGLGLSNRAALIKTFNESYASTAQQVCN